MFNIVHDYEVTPQLPDDEWRENKWVFYLGTFDNCTTITRGGSRFCGAWS